MKTTFKTILAVVVLSISFVVFQSFKTDDNTTKKKPLTQIIKYTASSTDKCGAGKCGDGKAKNEDKAKSDDDNAKCGAGKCGDGKAKDKDAKCGDGKCGDGKTKEGKASENSDNDANDTNRKKDKDAKCGTGKCGNGK